MSSSSDPSAPSPTSGCATPVRLPPVLPPEPCCGDEDPINGLKQLFVDYFRGRGMAAGRDPATRPVFLRLHGAVQGGDASSTELDYAGGERCLAVGDAAIAFDPLSSKGIVDALYTGLRAAAAICASEQGDSDAVGGYARHLREIHRVYREQCRAYYAMERRWLVSEFWRGRRELLAGVPDAADPSQTGSSLAEDGDPLLDSYGGLIPAA